MQLLVDDEANNGERAIYVHIDGGTVADGALQLFDELSATGYSLLYDDVLRAAVIDVQYYAAWAVLDSQRQATALNRIGEDTRLAAYEWAIIDPVLRAHCDLLQARLVEGSRSLGGDGFGLAVSEANQIYNEARKLMQQEAFCEPPFSLNYPTDPFGF